MAYSKIRAAAVLAALGAASVATPAMALDCRNIEMIVVWGAGGGTDIFMRTLGASLSEVLGIPVKAVNITGAAGENGRQELISRPADGCSVVSVDNDTITTEVIGQTKISLVKDLEPVFRGHVDIGMLIGRAGEFENWDALVAWAKANPGKLNMGGTGTAGADRSGIEVTLKAAGVDQFNYIPYDSAATMHADLLGGRLHGLYDEMGSTKGFVEAKQMAPLIVVNDARLATLPDVPAAGELGYRLSPSVWRGIAVKAGTPPEVVAELSAAMMKASESESYKKYESERSLDLVKTGKLGHQAFKELVAKEYEEAKANLQPN